MTEESYKATDSSQITVDLTPIQASLLVQTVKESAYNAGDLGSIPGLGRSPGEGNGKQFQYSCMENSMDRGAWWGYNLWCRKESDMTE